MAKRNVTHNDNALQLGLWDDPPQAEELPDYFETDHMEGVHGEQIPGVIVSSIDNYFGDTSPDALERLALEYLTGYEKAGYFGPPIPEQYRWRMECRFPIAGHERYIYIARSTSVIANRVYVAYEYDHCCHDLTREIDMSDDTGDL